jgi:hypothetical protein
MSAKDREAVARAMYGDKGLSVLKSVAEWVETGIDEDGSMHVLGRMEALLAMIRGGAERAGYERGYAEGLQDGKGDPAFHRLGEGPLPYNND